MCSGGGGGGRGNVYAQYVHWGGWGTARTRSRETWGYQKTGVPLCSVSADQNHQSNLSTEAGVQTYRRRGDGLGTGSWSQQHLGDVKNKHSQTENQTSEVRLKV